MSEPNNTFPFSGMEDSEELDVASIFGGGDPASDINPFDLPAAQAEQSATPQEQPQLKASETAESPVLTPEPPTHPQRPSLSQRNRLPRRPKHRNLPLPPSPPILFRRPLTSRKLKQLRWRPSPSLRSRRSLRTRA